MGFHESLPKDVELCQADELSSARLLRETETAF